MSFLKSLLWPNNRSLFTSYLTLLFGLLFFASLSLAGPLPTTPEDLIATHPHEFHARSHSHSHPIMKRGIKEFFHHLGQKIAGIAKGIWHAAKHVVGLD